ncbi:MAG: 4a-hydroxytetrahydrobiopterin dehydratase [Planctomycetota bacterium]|nr:4a-hydroxytetrahydrobiopterin dehydratase [Planctomycetota bacterium]
MRDEELAAALAGLPGWQQERDAIRRVYAFDDLGAANRFVRRVIDLALARDTTPAIEWDGGRVLIALGRGRGAGRGDVEFARRLDG